MAQRTTGMARELTNSARAAETECTPISSGPKPLAKSFTPPSERTDDARGVLAAPGFHITWVGNNRRDRMEAVSEGRTLFTVGDGYCVNAHLFSTDQDGHIIDGDMIAFVEDADHYQARCEAPRRERLQKLPGFGVSSPEAVRAGRSNETEALNVSSKTDRLHYTAGE